MDIEEGQKTGYFFDQRENRASIKPLMTGWGSRSGITLQAVERDGETKTLPVNKSGKEVTFPYWDGATVLECFSHTGSFTLHACKYGAKKVTCLDISEHAIESAKENVELNGFQDRVEFVVDDAFQYLRSQVKGLEERELRAQGDQKVDTSKPLTAGGGDPGTWSFWTRRRLPKPGRPSRGLPRVQGHQPPRHEAGQRGRISGYGKLLVPYAAGFVPGDDPGCGKDAGKILRLVEWRAAGKDHPQILGVDEDII